jgi:porin
MWTKLILGTGLSALALTTAMAQTAPASTAQPTLGQRLYDHGVSISLSYTGEAAANPTGGIRQGAQYAGQVFLGGDFDLAKIAGLTGSSVHIAITQRHGRSLANDDIGNNTSVQEVWGTQNTHLAYLYAEQKALNNRLDVRLGRVQANIFFLNSPLYCSFQTNSACGNPTFVFKDSNFTYFPASAWGGDATFNFTPAAYVHAGVYEVSPADRSINDYGLNWSGHGDTGVDIPAELGYKPNAATLYAIGGWYDTSAYADPLNDVNGTPALLAGQPYAKHHDRSGLFARFNLPVDQSGLSMFGVAMTRLTGQVNEAQYYELGLVQTGTFASRPNDDIGFVVNDQEFTPSFIHNIQAGRQSVGASPAGIPHREIMMELNYDYKLGSAYTIMPNLQYIINPDQSAEPTRRTNIPNAFVVGVKFTVDLAQLAGFAAPAQ